MDGQPTDFVDRPMEMSHHSMGIISPLIPQFGIRAGVFLIICGNLRELVLSIKHKLAQMAINYQKFFCSSRRQQFSIQRKLPHSYTPKKLFTPNNLSLLTFHLD